MSNDSEVKAPLLVTGILIALSLILLFSLEDLVEPELVALIWLVIANAWVCVLLVNVIIYNSIDDRNVASVWGISGVLYCVVQHFMFVTIPGLDSELYYTLYIAYAIGFFVVAAFSQLGNRKYRKAVTMGLSVVGILVTVCFTLWFGFELWFAYAASL